MCNQREEFWKKRSKNYEKLEWAIKSGYLHVFLDAGVFKPDDVVLDVGTGTGIIAHTISPFVKKVIGIDISDDMLSHAFEQRTDNEEFVNMDVRAMKFQDEKFSKIAVRMVFHHILEDTQRAMNECYRVLKKGGRIIFSEGVPPHEEVKSFYTEMFKLKEERITFTDDSLFNLVKQAGFGNIEKIIYWLRQASIRNWLDNSGLSEDTKNKIMQMHRNMTPAEKAHYNMKETEEDCLLDMKFVILTGEK